MAAKISGWNREQCERPKQFPRKMSGAPKLKGADGGNQNVEHKRSRTNDHGCKPKQRHRRDVTRCAGVANRRIQKSNETDSQKKRSQMCEIHCRTNCSHRPAAGRTRHRRTATGYVRAVTYGVIPFLMAAPAAEVTAAQPQHTNRLAQEKSPYLLQHAHNPVDWYPWGEEAFSKARR